MNAAFMDGTLITLEHGPTDDLLPGSAFPLGQVGEGQVTNQAGDCVEVGDVERSDPV